MISLPNGCSCSNPAVHPKNWKTLGASTQKDWYIHYRFKDPAYPQYPSGKLIIVKGMNHAKNRKDRKALAEGILAIEVDQLLKGYNPIVAKFKEVRPDTTGEISPATPFLHALQTAFTKLDCDPHTKEDIKSVLKYFSQSAVMLDKDKPLKEVKRRDIIAILDNCQHLTKTVKGKKVPKVWTSNQYNHYRKYLAILYAKLVELEGVEYNPIEGIQTKDVERKPKTLLTPEQRKTISNSKLTPEFKRFIHIFYHGLMNCLRSRFSSCDNASLFFLLVVICFTFGEQQGNITKFYLVKPNKTW